jgi:hypothetical protein
VNVGTTFATAETGDLEALPHHEAVQTTISLKRNVDDGDAFLWCDGRRRDSATSRAETPSTSRRRSTARLAREKVLERRRVVAVALVVPARRLDHRVARTRALVAATSCIWTSGRCPLDHRANARALGRGVASCPASAEKESKWR